MKNLTRIYLAILLLLSFVFIFGCGRKDNVYTEKGGLKTDAANAASEKEGPGPDKPASPELLKQKVLAFNLEGLTDKGQKKWDVTGESAESFTESQIKLNNIVARSYGQDTEATITSDRGIYDKTRNNVILQKNVKATIENAQEGSENMLNLPAGTKPMINVSERSGAKKQKKMTVITCNGDAQFDYEKNRAYFDRDVRVVSDDGSIDADRITVNLDVATKKVKDIVAEGNVKISRGDNVTYSDKATYIEEDKKVVLTGQPKLVIYQEGDQGSFLGDFGNMEKR